VCYAEVDRSRDLFPTYRRLRANLASANVNLDLHLLTSFLFIVIGKKDPPGKWEQRISAAAQIA
jgi:hypothetical protein